MLNTDTNREACLTRHYRITASLASQFPTCCWFAAPKIREGRRDLDEPIARAIDDPLETLLRNRSSNGIFVSVVNELRGEEMNCLKEYRSPLRVVKITPTGTSFQVPGIAITALWQPSWSDTSFRISGNADTVQLPQLAGFGLGHPSGISTPDFAFREMRPG